MTIEVILAIAGMILTNAVILIGAWITVKVEITRLQEIVKSLKTTVKDLKEDVDDLGDLYRSVVGAPPWIRKKADDEE